MDLVAYIRLSVRLDVFCAHLLEAFDHKFGVKDDYHLSDVSVISRLLQIILQMQLVSF